MRLNVALYRVMAYVTGVVLIVLCILAIMQIFVHDEAAVNVVGTIHGALYIVYLLVAFPLTRRLRLTAGPTAMRDEAPLPAMRSCHPARRGGLRASREGQGRPESGDRNSLSPERRTGVVRRRYRRLRGGRFRPRTRWTGRG